MERVLLPGAGGIQNDLLYGISHFQRIFCVTAILPTAEERFIHLKLVTVCRIFY
jgi:hypothetical protein